MNKKIISLVAGATLLFAGSVSAASISGLGTAIFSNQTNLYGNAGQTVQVSTNFDVPAGEVLHAIQTDMIGDFVGPVCHTVAITEGAQTNVAEAFSETLPPNAGDYGFTMKAFTAATVPQANALNANQGTACTGSSNSVYNQSNVVHVLPGGSVTGGVGTSNDCFFGICSIADLKAALGIGATTTPTAPSGDIQCAAFNAANAGTQPNVYSDANTALQGYLLSQRISIPALKAGAAFGFYGNQTTSAVGQWRSMHPTCF